MLPIVLAVAAVAMTNPGKPTAVAPLVITAKGRSVEVRGQLLGRSLTATASQVATPDDKGWMILSGADKQPAELWLVPQPPDRAGERFKGREIRVRLSDGVIHIPGAGADRPGGAK